MGLCAVGLLGGRGHGGWGSLSQRKQEGEAPSRPGKGWGVSFLPQGPGWGSGVT